MTLKPGLSVFAARMFAGYGYLTFFVTKQVNDESIRFSELALELLNRFERPQYTARVIVFVYAGLRAWRSPNESVLEELSHAMHVGLVIGDLEYVSLCRYCSLSFRFETGMPISTVLAEQEMFRETTLNMNQRFMFEISFPIVQLVYHFMGISTDLLLGKGDIIGAHDENHLWKTESELKLLSFERTIFRMWLAYVFNDFDLAGRCLPEVLQGMETVPLTFVMVNTTIFKTVLVALAVARERKNYSKNLAFCKRKLKALGARSTN